MAPPDCSPVVDSISKLFNNSKHSDLTIVASDGTSFPAHLAILSGYTPFFDTALASDFVESTTRTVNFPEHSNDAVKAFLEFCYTGDYTRSLQDNFDLDFEVLELAAYIIAPHAQYHAVKTVVTSLDREDAPITTKMDRKAVIPKLVEHVFLHRFGKTAMNVVVYGAVKGIAEHGEEFVECLERVMSKYGDFAAAVLRKYALDAKYRVKVSCTRCGLITIRDWSPGKDNIVVCGTAGCKFR